MLKNIYHFLLSILLTVFKPLDAIRLIKATPSYLGDFFEIKRQYRNSDKSFPFGTLKPCLTDREDDSGSARGHYFHQDLLVARRVFENRPVKHVDIGSRIDGFVAHVASFREIEVLDIRELRSNVYNITFSQADLMAPVPQEYVNYSDSVSCLHALEHFGLGRYGDPVKYEGILDGVSNLIKIVKPGGLLYLSVPLGPQRIEFNAHRVFSADYLISMFGSELELQRFSYVDDAGDLHDNVEITAAKVRNNFSCYYGCAILELKKI